MRRSWRSCCRRRIWPRRDRSKSARARTRSWSTSMDGMLHFPMRPALDLLFDEDFDAAQEEAEILADPEIIEPHFTAADIETARNLAWCEGRQAGLAEAHAGESALLAQSLAGIADGLQHMRDDARRHAEEAAEAVAQVMLES